MVFLALKSCKKLFKAYFAYFYYNNLLINSYWFLQQYKDHFETAKAKKQNQILFPALFLYRSVT